LVDYDRFYSGFTFIPTEFYAEVISIIGIGGIGVSKNRVTVFFSSESANGDLNWVHTAISNPKKNLLGIYHVVSEKYLQSYLNEFAYKLNRRYFGDKLFNRLIIASVYPHVRHSE